MKLIKELDDIIQDTPPDEIRTDLEFTRDKLLSSLHEDDDEKEKEKGRERKRNDINNDNDNNKNSNKRLS